MPKFHGSVYLKLKLFIGFQCFKIWSSIFVFSGLQTTLTELFHFDVIWKFQVLTASCLIRSHDVSQANPQWASNFKSNFFVPKNLHKQT